jgi:transposase
MAKFIMVGCDLHDKSMLLKIGTDDDGPAVRPVVRTWGTDGPPIQAMIRDLHARRQRCGAGRIVFAYEACGFGFRLHDELTAAGIEAHVLAPSKMARSVKHRKGKTDEKDAQKILEIVRSNLLAGVEMPSVWIPDLATRDDRELLRRRLAVAEDCAKSQIRVRWLLKSHGIGPSLAGGNWNDDYWQWLEQLAAGGLPPGAGAGLGSLMRQIQWHYEEIERLDEQVAALSKSPRYSPLVAAVRRRKGVGLLTAMVFLTELGDVERFRNRQQVGAYLGLSPTSYESGDDDDHKGHITRQGPSRVRKVLCQAVWSRMRVVEKERQAYERIVARNPRHKKIAVVARMRALGIMMWHEAVEAQRGMRAATTAAKEVMA